MTASPAWVLEIAPAAPTSRRAEPASLAGDDHLGFVHQLARRRERLAQERLDILRARGIDLLVERLAIGEKTRIFHGLLEGGAQRLHAIGGQSRRREERTPHDLRADNQAEDLPL